jgi:hypothetical protein
MRARSRFNAPSLGWSVTVHRIAIVVASVALIVIGVVDFLAVRKMPGSRQLPGWFLLYMFLTSIVVSAAAAILFPDH